MFGSALVRGMAFLALIAVSTASAVPLVIPGLPPASDAHSPAQGKIESGLAALNRNDLLSAEAAFKEAAQIDPKSASPYLGLAEIAGRRNQPRVAESLLRKAMETDSKNVQAVRAWGRFQFNQGKFAEAEAAFRRVTELAPTFAEGHVNLAENYLRGMKRPAEAAQAYRKALELDAASLPAQMGLAAALAAQGQHTAAAVEYERAARLAPQNPQPLHALGRMYASQARFADARAALQRAIKVAPKEVAAYIDLGDVYLAQDDSNQAVATFRTATRTATDPSIAYFRLGQIHQAAQRWSDAEQAYLAATRVDPRLYGAYNNLAWMSAERKARLDDALAWARKALELAPKSATVHHTVGWVHRARGELDAAAAAVEQAVGIAPSQPKYHYHLGLIYVAQGKTKAAVAAFEKALGLGTDFPEAGDARSQLQALRAKKTPASAG